MLKDDSVFWVRLGHTDSGGESELKPDGILAPIGDAPFHRSLLEGNPQRDLIIAASEQPGAEVTDIGQRPGAPKAGNTAAAGHTRLVGNELRVADYQAGDHAFAIDDDAVGGSGDSAADGFLLHFHVGIRKMIGAERDSGPDPRS